MKKRTRYCFFSANLAFASSICCCSDSWPGHSHQFLQVAYLRYQIALRAVGLDQFTRISS